MSTSRTFWGANSQAKVNFTVLNRFGLGTLLLVLLWLSRSWCGFWKLQQVRHS